MKTHRFLVSLVIFTVLVFTLLIIESCKKDNDVNNVPTPLVYTNGEGEIGPIGGTVLINNNSSILNGCGVTVPAGALNNNVFIQIEHASSMRFPDDTTASVIKFLPENIKFLKPVTVFFPYTEGTDTSNLNVYYYDPDSSIIEQIDIVRIDGYNNTIYCETDHF